MLAKAHDYSTLTKIGSPPGVFAVRSRRVLRMKVLCMVTMGLALVPLHAQQPSPSAIEHRLVNIDTIYPPLLPEIRYATTYNFTGQTLYPAATAYVRDEVAEALRKVQVELMAEGLGLKIYDGYRPLSVQAKMWELVPDERYVSDPNKSKGKHTRGTAVDVTLVDRYGNELKMPTPYDDFTERAHRSSAPKWTEDEKANSQKLEAVMVKHGFVPFPFEWWHFDYANWEKCPPLNISFQDLQKGVKTAIPVP